MINIWRSTRFHRDSLQGEESSLLALARARSRDRRFFSVYADSPTVLFTSGRYESQCHRFSDSQRTDYKSWACKCAFYRADSSKCSSRRRAVGAGCATREKCIRNRRWGVDVCGIRGTPSRKRRFKYKVNYIPARFHQR